MSASKISPAQQRYLRNVSAGRPVNTGIYGQAAHGGLTQTRMALLRKGLIAFNPASRRDEITEVGEAALSVEEI